MRRSRIPIAAAMISLLLAVPGVAADVSVSIAVSDGELREFHAAIGAHFHVSDADLVVIRKRNIPDDELPVVFLVAGRARVAPGVIVDLRLRGWSWMQVCAHFRLTAEIFRVEVSKPYGPPYGHAYGYFKERKREEWASIRLTDGEAIHLANVRFLAEHHGCSADVVLYAYKAGEGFARLHAKVREEKAKSEAKGAGAGENPEKANEKGAADKKSQDRSAASIDRPSRSDREGEPKASHSSGGAGGGRGGGRRGK